MSLQEPPRVELYVVQVKVKMGRPESFHNISVYLQSTPGTESARCLYTFKVIGEPLVVVVVEVTHFAALEKILTSLMNSEDLVHEVQCDPVVTYEGFAKRLGVGEELTKPSPRNMNLNRCIWARVNIEYPGMTLDELITHWKPEAKAVLGARKDGKQVEIFKMAAQRKLHVFSSSSAEEWDEMSFILPQMRTMGNCVNIVTKSLVSLDTYMKEFPTSTSIDG